MIAPDPDKAPVLIVLHQETSTPGRVGRLLMERGYPLDIRRPRFGDPLPDTLAHHAGAVIFGGPMSANDEEDFIRRETDWIAVPLKERKPYLGLCLGAQIMARHLGARVYAHEQGRAEIGYYPLTPTHAGAAVAKRLGTPWPGHVYHWHREGFDCPPGAVTLATGDDFPVQAVRYGPAAYAFQFHPEVTYAMTCRWTTRAHERMKLPGAKPRNEHLEGRLIHDPAVNLWIDAFLDYWLAGGCGEDAERHGAPAFMDRAAAQSR
jgi:GMP synthase (glutamine-hydrolysing)